MWAPAHTAPGRPELISREADPPNLEMPVGALEGWVTPSRSFFESNHFRRPAPAESWGLQVSGEVDHPGRLGLWEIKRLPATSQWVTIECAGNKRAYFDPPAEGTPWRSGAVGNAQWTGVPLRSVLERFMPRDGALEVRFTGADRGRYKETGQTVHYERSLPLAEALRDEVMVAWAMNGEPLPHDHGGPLRLIVPGWYGMAHLKWLIQIELRREPFRGPFQVREYVYLPEPGAYDRAVPVTVARVNSLISQPEDGETVKPGRTVLRGAAWSGAAPVSAVEVSLDGGQSWEQAELTGPVAPHAWRLWHFLTPTLRPGGYTALARATDAAGQVQPATAPWNAKGYGNNQYATVRFFVTMRGGVASTGQPLRPSATAARRA